MVEQLVLDSRLLDASRQAAFAKRSAAVAAQAGDTGTALGVLCVVQRMLR